MNNGLAEKAKSWDNLNKHFNGFLDLYINHYSTLVDARNNRLAIEKIKETMLDVSMMVTYEEFYNFVKDTLHSNGSGGTKD